MVCYAADRNELRSRVIQWLQTEIVPDGWFAKGSNFSEVLLKYFKVGFCPCVLDMRPFVQDTPIPVWGAVSLFPFPFTLTSVCMSEENERMKDGDRKRVKVKHILKSEISNFPLKVIMHQLSPNLNTFMLMSLSNLVLICHIKDSTAAGDGAVSQI